MCVCVCIYMCVCVCVCVRARLAADFIKIAKCTRVHDEWIENSWLYRSAVCRYDSQSVLLEWDHERTVTHGAYKSQTIALILLHLDNLQRCLRMRPVAFDNISSRYVEMSPLSVKKSGYHLGIVVVVHEIEVLWHRRLKRGHPIVHHNDMFGKVVVVMCSVWVKVLGLADNEGAIQTVRQLNASVRMVPVGSRWGCLKIIPGRYKKGNSFKLYFKMDTRISKNNSEWSLAPKTK